jgi:hypothetical protein
MNFGRFSICQKYAKNDKNHLSLVYMSCRVISLKT